MKGRFLAMAGVLAVACTVRAQDGGKVPWKGKGATDDVKAIMADAQKNGKAMMIFFTSEG